MKQPIRRSLTVLVALAAMFALAIGGATTADAKPRQATPTAIPISGSDADQSFTGLLDVTRFSASNGALSAIGTVTGTVTNTITGVATPVTQAVTVPVQLDPSSGTCQILHLVLGPLDLDLLGLVIHLDQVVLDITAQSGPGNLLGNLLCAVAGLLDGPTGVNAIVTQIAALLNQLLGVLR